MNASRTRRVLQRMMNNESKTVRRPRGMQLVRYAA